MPDSIGDHAQLRKILEQLREVDKDVPEAKTPVPLKWAGGIVAAIMSVGSAGLLFWMISSISQMQLVLARMDERQSMNTTNWEAKFRGLDERMGRLEAQKEARR